MSRSSESVRKWRKRTKQRMIESMGGECQCCSYNKCNAALQFHHIDPSTKDRDSRLGKNIKSWARIVDELKKCVLLCGNCHAEIHAGIRILPNEYKRFDSKYEKYKKSEDIQYTSCFYCGKMKSKKLKFCSYACRDKFRERANWSNIDLLEMSEKYNNCELGRLLSVSEKTIRKRIIKLREKQNEANTSNRE